MPEEQRFLVKFLVFGYTIEYKPGITNKVADALSRRVEISHTGDELPITTIQNAQDNTSFYAYTQQLISLFDQLKKETK